jgi:hypothetical protein
MMGSRPAAAIASSSDEPTSRNPLRSPVRRGLPHRSCDAGRPPFSRRQLRRTYIEMAVDLHRVAVDDLGWDQPASLSAPALPEPVGPTMATRAHPRPFLPVYSHVIPTFRCLICREVARYDAQSRFQSSEVSMRVSHPSGCRCSVSRQPPYPPNRSPGR